MITSKVLAKGPFPPHNITIKINKKSNRKIDPYVEDQLATIWQTTLKQAQERKQKIYDGLSYRLDSFIWDKDKLHVELSLIKFSVRSSLNHMNEKLGQMGEDYYAKGLAIAGLLQTKDNKYIFGKRGPISPSSPRIDFIGGVLEEMKLESAEDLLQKNVEELQEETGITKDKIEKMSILGLVLSESTNVIIVTDILLNISSLEAREIFDTAEREDEMSDLIFIDETDLKQYLLELGGYKTTVTQLL